MRAAAIACSMVTAIACSIDPYKIIYALYPFMHYAINCIKIIYILDAKYIMVELKKLSEQYVLHPLPKEWQKKS